jgi:hypothetical protein
VTSDRKNSTFEAAWSEALVEDTFKLTAPSRAAWRLRDL